MTREEAAKHIWSLEKELQKMANNQIEKPNWNKKQISDIREALIIASNDLYMASKVEKFERKDNKSVTIEGLKIARDFAKSIGFDVPKKLKAIKLEFGVNEAPLMSCEAYPDFEKLTNKGK